MNALSRGVRNAFRNSIRTFSIVIILGLSIGLALTMVMARKAVESKIASVKGSIGNTITISPAGARGFDGGGEPLTEEELSKVSSIDHVTSITKTLQDRLSGTSTNLQSAIEAGSLGRRNRRNSGTTDVQTPGDAGGTFTPPVIVTGTNDPAATGVLAGGGTVSVIDGAVFAKDSNDNVAVLGKALAAKNNLSVGSTFMAYGTEIKVVAIYDAGNEFANSALVMPLTTVQRLSDQAGDVSSAIAHVDSISNVDAATTAIKESLGTAADVVSQQDTSSQALAPLENIASISTYSLIGAVATGAAIILLTMLMIVRERRREIGVLKAIGSSNLRIMAQFVTESVTFTVLGALVGLVIGVLASGPVTDALVASNSNAAPTVTAGGHGFGGGVARVFGQGGANLRNIHAIVGWDILLYGLGAAVVIAVIGSAIPAWFISKVRPAEVMRAE